MNFKLKSDYKPTGDQPQAIKVLVNEITKLVYHVTVADNDYVSIADSELGKEIL